MIDDRDDEDLGFSYWFDDHKTGLEEDWFDKQCPPVLDDDMCDYLDDNIDDFMDYARERYGIETQR